jgi:hypothetical protein
LSRGLQGRVIGLWPDLPPTPAGPPLAVPFEPIALDEADPKFHELETAGPISEDVQDARANREASNELMRRRLRRTFVYTGVWVSLAIFSFNLLLAGVKSIVERRLDHDVVLWGALLLLIVWQPFVLHSFKSQTLLLVPSGLVLRKARRRTTQSDVHLFTRNGSVMVLRPLHKELWTLMTFDGREFAFASVSRKEMGLLLRTWLSPLDPPSPEKLVDLT